MGRREYLSGIIVAVRQNSVYKDAYNQMSEVLYSSYDYLDQHLKASFLYLGAFPQNNRIPWYQLINLWSVEGFPDSEPIRYSYITTTSALSTHYYLLELCSKNVIRYDRQGGYQLHSSFWYMCNKEASNSKFFYAFNCRADALREEGIKYEHRLCIRNSILFAIKDVHNSIASAKNVRSLLCTGPYHHYQVPLCLEHLRLLRVFEAQIRFYEFPMEAVKLVQLRYLTLVYDGNLPTSISKLLNIQYLIVHRHQNIVKSNASLLPIEIWNMKELKFLHIMGRDLPHPYGEVSFLPNLLELIGIGPQSCTKDVLEKIPSLEDLGIQIELAPDAFEPLSCFDHISHLHQLKVLYCAIANPTFKTKVVTPVVPLSDFPSSLERLTLSGLGYPWEEMSKISSLPNLSLLKLKCYAFRGPKWRVHDHEFQRLELLYIEDTDLEQWTFQNYSCLHTVNSVSIVHCYKLKEIPLTFGRSLRTINVVDCNPLAENCANELKRGWDNMYGDREHSLGLSVRSSCDDRKI